MTEQEWNLIGNNIGDWILVLASFFMLLFSIHYTATAPFWYLKIRQHDGTVVKVRNALGRMFFFLGWSTVIFGGVVVLSLFLGTEYPGRVWVRLIGYSFYAAATASFFVTYIHERRSADPQLATHKKGESK